MSLLRTVFRVFVSQVLSALLGIAGLVVFTNVLGAGRFGIFVLFQASIQILSVITDFGVHGAIEKRISEGADKSILGTGIIILVLLLAVTNTAILVFQGPINSYIGEQLARLLVVGLTAEQFGKLFKRTLAGEMKVGLVETAMLIRRTVFYSVGIVVVVLGAGIESLIALFIITWIVFCVWAVYELSTPINWPTMVAARSIARYSKYNFIASVVGTQAYSWLDTLIIGLYLSPAAVTAYEIAWRITKIVLLLSRSIAQSIFPHISQWDAQGDTESVEGLIPNAIASGLLIVVPAITGTAIFGEELLRLVFGPTVAVAAVPLLILMIGKIPEAVNLVIGRVLLGVDRPDLVARATGAFIVVNLVLNFALIPTFGLQGAAVATSLSFTLNASLVAYFVSDIVDIRIDYHMVGVSVVAAAAMGTVLVALRTVVTVNTLYSLFAMIGLGVVCYSATLLLSPTVRGQFVDIVR